MEPAAFDLSGFLRSWGSEHAYLPVLRGLDRNSLETDKDPQLSQNAGMDSANRRSAAASRIGRTIRDQLHSTYALYQKKLNIRLVVFEMKKVYEIRKRLRRLNACLG